MKIEWNFEKSDIPMILQVVLFAIVVCDNFGPWEGFGLIMLNGVLLGLYGKYLKQEANGNLQWHCCWFCGRPWYNCVFVKEEEMIQNIGIGIVGLVLIGLLAWGGFKVERWFHWEFQYRDNVEQTIREMVKEECLKEHVK